MIFKNKILRTQARNIVQWNHLLPSIIIDEIERRCGTKSFNLATAFEAVIEKTTTKEMK